ncbi:MAG: hypothetical protein HXY30_04105 [Pseudorhodoplanes sp.]|nr:hypothetical protein [Pseudorhodoplanes sp.]
MLKRVMLGGFLAAFAATLAGAQSPRDFTPGLGFVGSTASVTAQDVYVFTWLQSGTEVRVCRVHGPLGNPLPADLKCASVTGTFAPIAAVAAVPDSPFLPHVALSTATAYTSLPSAKGTLKTCVARATADDITVTCNETPLP